MPAHPLQPPLRPSDAEILAAFRALRYPLPSSRPVVVGLRRLEEEDSWNDVLGALGGGLSLFFRGTTDPGKAPREGRGNIPTHPEGVARVLPGYYPGAFRWHFHNNDRAHPCLGQAAPMAYERWKNGRWTRYPAETRGFNLHRALKELGRVPANVGDFSHACAVIPEKGEHWSLLEALGFPNPPWTASQQAVRFDYALIDWTAYLAARG